MVRVKNLFALCEIGKLFSTLAADLPNAKSLADIAITALEVRHMLQHLLRDDILEFKACKRHAEHLMALLDTKTLKRLSKPLSPSDITTIRETASAFLQSLHDELAEMQVYLANQIRAFSMPMLVENGEKSLDAHTLKTIPIGAVRDIKEGCRCLAFELSTAAGIHMMRAYEKTLRAYYQSLTKRKPGRETSLRLIKRLRELKLGHPKVIGVIDQIRELHRNPLAHAIFLNMDEAIGLFEISKSAISAMATEL